ncbi:MAG: nickel-dependent lactate racemase [Lawsonibacter sp.]|nr:nickel-dependent lactate racemase [Lawsonibacter sp.]
MVKMNYGGTELSFDLPQGVVKEHLLPRPLEGACQPVEHIIEDALQNPIGAPLIEEVVRPGDTVCIIISDITRSWQPTSQYLPLLIAKLNRIGIPDCDIKLLSANGTHRRQTPEEHLTLIGEELFHRFQIIDHQCDETESLSYLGKTSRGTPVWLNSVALNADKLILTGGITCHSMAGFGGGRKSVVPGIAGRETINTNHCNVLNPGFGNGVHPSIRCGCMDMTNPMHTDLMEAAAFAKPDYLLNIVVGEEHTIVKAFAGDWIQAHQAGADYVDQADSVPVKGRCQYVIASTGGAPKDINLYQASKTLANAVQMTAPGGTILLLAQCPEGFGDEDCRRQIVEFTNMEDRERALRNHFTIGGFMGYLFANAAEQFRFILVSQIPKELFQNTKILPASSIEEALALSQGSAPEQTIALMPQSSKTMPKFIV